MDYIRVVDDTQISTVPCFIKSITLDHSAATVVILYNSATATSTDTLIRFTLRNSTVELTKVVIFPGRGLRFETGCYLLFADTPVGEVYYAMG